MPASALIPIGAAIAGPIASKVLGGSTPTQTPGTPSDLLPMRAQQIGLLQYLLGMGPDPRIAGTASSNASAAANGRSRPAAPSNAQQSQLQTFANQFSNPAAVVNYVQGLNGQPQGIPGATTYQPQPIPTTPIMGPAGGGIGGTTGIQVPHLAMGGTVYAHGGMVHGPGTAASDSIPARLSNGEGVINAHATQALGGPQIIALLNHLGAQHQARQAQSALPMGLQQILHAHGLAQQPQAPMPQHFALGGTAQLNPTTVTDSANPVGTSPTQPPLTSGLEPGGTSNPPPASSDNGTTQTPQQRLESLYGPLGITPSGLQNQATNAYSQFLNQPSPSDRAAQTTLPQLTQNLTGNSSTQGAINGLMGLQTGAGADVTGRLGQIASNPGTATGNAATNQALQNLGTGTSGTQSSLQALSQLAAGGAGQVNAGGVLDPTAAAALGQLASTNPGLGVLSALQPAFQQNLAAADQTGGRFGTSNALGRAQATNQYNQLAQQALQQGATQQQQAASSLGDLANTAQGQTVQAAIASAGNQIGGLNTAVNALGQSGNQQLGATGQAINANQGLNSNVLSALGQLGGFNLAGQSAQAQNLGTAGNLGVQQGNLGNNAAATIGNIANTQGTQDLNAVNSAYGAGANNTTQQNQGQQTTIQLINQLLGTAQGASLGGPVVSTPGVGTQVTSGLAGLLPYLSQLGLGAGSPAIPVSNTAPAGGYTGGQTVA